MSFLFLSYWLLLTTVYMHYNLLCYIAFVYASLSDCHTTFSHLYLTDSLWPSNLNSKCHFLEKKLTGLLWNDLIPIWYSIIIFKKIFTFTYMNVWFFNSLPLAAYKFYINFFYLLKYWQINVKYKLLSYIHCLYLPPPICASWFISTMELI